MIGIGITCFGGERFVRRESHLGFVFNIATQVRAVYARRMAPKLRGDLVYRRSGFFFSGKQAPKTVNVVIRTGNDS